MATKRAIEAEETNTTTTSLKRRLPSFQTAKRPHLSYVGEEANLKYSDRYVCRPFLMGLCLRDLFYLTINGMGLCSSEQHSLRLRKEYEEAKVKGIVNYDGAFEKVLLRQLDNSRRRTARVLQFLIKKDARAVTSISVTKVTQTPEVKELSKQIKDKMKEADEFEFEGKTRLRIRALKEVEKLKTKRADKEAMLLFDAFSEARASILQRLSSPPPLAHQPALAPVGAKQGIVDEPQKAKRQEPVRVSDALDITIDDGMLRVCDICGDFLFVHSSARELADHFRGELHLAYMQMREKLTELQEKSGLQEEKNKEDKLYEDDSRSVFEYYLNFDTEDEIDYERGIINSMKYHGHPNEPSDQLCYNIDAALSSSCPYEVYIFMGQEYMLLKYAPDTTDDRVLEGPMRICCGFRTMWSSTISDYGVNCAFRCKDTTEAFFFSDSDCIKINLAPHSRGCDSEIERETSIDKMFPCLKGTEFDSDLDAAFESSVDGEAYLFKGNQYALISYGRDRKLIATGPITEAFPCLRNTIFDSGIGAAFTSHRPQQVYLFKEQYYALMSFTPGSTGGDSIIGGVKEILLNWSSLREMFPRHTGETDHFDCINQQYDEYFEELA